MKTKLNKDYNHVPLMCYSPEPDFDEITGGLNIEVHNYLVVSFDTTVDVYFNKDDSLVFSQWPAGAPLQLTNKINFLTVSETCTMSFMWANKSLDFSDIDTSDFLVDDEGSYLVDEEGKYLTSA